MQVATIGELHEICGGNMRFGNMPPLAGEHTPMTRIVHHISEVVANVIFWPLDPVGEKENSMAEEAYHQGATGVVVTGRRVIPWAGCWSLQVPDAWSAWLNWQSWVTHSAPQFGHDASKCETTTRRAVLPCTTKLPSTAAQTTSAQSKSDTQQKHFVDHPGLPSHPHISKIGEPDSFSMEEDAARGFVVRIAQRVENNRENIG